MLIQTDSMIPAVYTQESRDFQIYLKLYDNVLNTIKNDVDSMQYLTDTNLIRSEALLLLQTKVGFFTNYSVSADIMRGILKVFPYIIKNKGTLLGIKQAVRAFLNIYNIKADMKVYYTPVELVQGNMVIPDHTVVVGISEKVDSFYMLEEIFRYILPAGYGSMFYYYSEAETETGIQDKHTAYRLTVGQDINSSIRYRVSKDNLPSFSESETYALGTLVINEDESSEDIFRCIQAIKIPGECTSANWTLYWETVSLDQENIYPYAYSDKIRDVLLNATDTIMIYDSSLENTELSDTDPNNI